MTDLILIDTSVWVRYLRHNPDPKIVQQVRAWLDSGGAATTELVRIELQQAARTEGEFERLAERLDALCQLTPDAAVWRTAARNAFTLHRSGILVPTTDLIIATVAAQANAQLAHLDRHYEMIAPRLGLRTLSLLGDES